MMCSKAKFACTFFYVPDSNSTSKPLNKNEIYMILIILFSYLFGNLWRTEIVTWFAKSYQMAAGARKVVESFRARRAHMSKLPSPTITNVTSLLDVQVVTQLDAWATLKRLVRGQKYKSFAMNPHTTDTQLKARQLDYIILAYMGLVSFESDKLYIAMHADGSEGFVRAANRLQNWDQEISMPDLRRMIPSHEADGGVPVGGDQDGADELCALLKRLVSGEEVDLERMKALSPGEAGQDPSLSASQVQMPQAAAAPAATGQRRPALTQASQPDNSLEEELEPPPKMVRLRQVPDPTAEDFAERLDLKKKIIMSMLKSEQDPYTASKNKTSFKSLGSEEEVEQAFNVALIWCHHVGLGTKSRTGARIKMAKPPADKIPEVSRELGLIFYPLAANPTEKMRKEINKDGRVEQPDFSMEKFLAGVQILKGGAS